MSETREQFSKRLHDTALNAYDNRDHPPYMPALLNAAAAVYDMALRDVYAEFKDLGPDNMATRFGGYLYLFTEARGIDLDDTP